MDLEINMLPEKVFTLCDAKSVAIDLFPTTSNVFQEYAGCLLALACNQTRGVHPIHTIDHTKHMLQI